MRPRRKKKKDSSLVKDGYAALQLLLATLRESSDPCPPLKGVVGGLAKVLELIEKTKTNKEDMKGLIDRMDDIANKLADAIPDATSVSAGLLQALEDFQKTVDEICEEAGKLAKKGVLKRFIRQTDQRAAIETLIAKLDHAWRLFNSTSSIRLELTQQVILLNQRGQMTDLQEVRKRMERIEYNTLVKPSKIEAGSLIVNKHFEAGVLTGSLAMAFLFP